MKSNSNQWAEERDSKPASTYLRIANSRGRKPVMRDLKKQQAVPNPTGINVN